jgi:hypothetical protein
MPEANILAVVSVIVVTGLVAWVAFVWAKVKAPWALSEDERDALMGDDEAPASAPVETRAGDDTDGTEASGKESGTKTDVAP